jgi:hypothetical protein
MLSPRGSKRSYPRIMGHAEPRWILDFTFDAIASSVRIVLTADPERATHDKEVLIKGVSAFHIERYHEPEEVCLGDCLGCTVAPHGTQWRYKLDTGDAVICFDAQENVSLWRNPA